METAKRTSIPAIITTHRLGGPQFLKLLENILLSIDKGLDGNLCLLFDVVNTITEDRARMKERRRVLTLAYWVSTHSYIGPVQPTMRMKVLGNLHRTIDMETSTSMSRSYTIPGGPFFRPCRRLRVISFHEYKYVIKSTYYIIVDSNVDHTLESFEMTHPGTTSGT